AGTGSATGRSADSGPAHPAGAASGAAGIVGDVAQARDAVAGDRPAELGGRDHGVGAGVERIAGGGGGGAVVVGRGAAAERERQPEVVAVVAAGGVVVAGVRFVLVLGHELARSAQHDQDGRGEDAVDRKSTRLNSSHVKISYAGFCLEKKNR